MKENGTTTIFEHAPELQHFRLRGGWQQLHHWSHGVFGLSALLLLSGYFYLPGNAAELLHFFKGLLPLTLVLLVYYRLWRAQQIFLLRFGLSDRRTRSLFAVVLLVSILMLYPLRYLFDWLSAYFYYLAGTVLVDRDFFLYLDRLPESIPEPLLGWILTGTGLAVLVLAAAFYLMYDNARECSLTPSLDAAEHILTSYEATRWLTLMWVSALSILLALAGLWLKSGFLLFMALPVYLLSWLLAPWQMRKSYRQLRSLREEL